MKNQHSTTSIPEICVHALLEVFAESLLSVRDKDVPLEVVAGIFYSKTQEMRDQLELNSEQEAAYLLLVEIFRAKLVNHKSSD